MRISDLSSDVCSADLSPDDVVLGVLPLVHIFGLNVVLNLSLMAGATTLLIERFDPQSALDAISAHGVTIISGAPAMWTAWAALPGAPASSFATVSTATYGAVRVEQYTRRQIQARYTVCLLQAYAGIEGPLVVTTHLCGAHPID